MKENNNPIKNGNVWPLLSLISGGLAILLMLYLEFIVGVIIFSIAAIICATIGFKTNENKIFSFGSLIFVIFWTSFLILLFLSWPSPSSRIKAKDAKIVADMRQLKILAGLHYDNNNSYTGFEKDPVAVTLKDDIVKMKGTNLAINISPKENQYCAKVLLNKKAWYCIDSILIPKEYSDNPKCSDDYFACEDATIHWRTYRNEEYRFEFKYPEEWYDHDNKRILVSQDSKMDIEIIAAYEFSKDYTLKEWAEKSVAVKRESDYILYIGTDYITNKIEEINIAGKEVVISSTIWGITPPDFKGQAWPTGRLQKDVFFPCEGLICAIKINFPWADRNQYEPLFNQILSTIQFLD